MITSFSPSVKLLNNFCHFFEVFPVNFFTTNNSKSTISQTDNISKSIQFPRRVFNIFQTLQQGPKTATMKREEL